MYLCILNVCESWEARKMDFSPDVLYKKCHLPFGSWDVWSTTTLEVDFWVEISELPLVGLIFNFEI